jgi:nucleosome assembly protein 1-like 1
MTTEKKDLDLPASFDDPLEKEIEQKMVKTILQMPKEIQDRFKVLHMLSDKRSKLNDEFNDACKKVEAKIREKKRPLLQKRTKLIDGEEVDTTELVSRFEETHKDLEKKVAAIVKPEGEQEDEPQKEPTDVSYLKGKKGVPDFWLRAIKNNRLLWDQCKEKDQEILQHIKHVETEVTEDESSKNMTITLRLTFHDAVSEFMSPSILECALEYESEDQVKEIKGTEIQWVEGKDPTKKKIKKKQKHKKTGETRTVVKTVDADSFFKIF